MKALNFNNVQKRYFTVTLNDDDQTKLMISSPTKRIMDDLTALQDTLKTVQDQSNEAEISVDTIQELYDICAKIMSRNKTGFKITGVELGEIFDLEDVTIFFMAYMEFVTEVSSAKN